MKKRRACIVALSILMIALSSGRALAPEGESAVKSKGYWKRIGVSKEFFHTYDGKQDVSQYYQRLILDGRARIAFIKETPAGTANAETLFIWDIPGDTYQSGESVSITLHAEVLKCDSKSDAGFPVWGQSVSANLEFASAVTSLTVPGQEYGRNYAVVYVNQGDARVIESDTLEVSGRFPQGVKGDRMTLNVHISGLGAVHYLYEFTDEPESSVSQAEGWWELVDVEMKGLPEYPYLDYSLSRGMAAKYVHLEPWVGNRQYALSHMSFFWTEPSQRYLPGQYADINISLSLDQYVDNGRLPTAGDWMNAGFLPGIAFKDDTGRWSATVTGSGGVITKGSDSLIVSGLIPGKEWGQELVIYVSSQSFGQVLYHYQWRHD